MHSLWLGAKSDEHRFTVQGTGDDHCDPEGSSRLAVGNCTQYLLQDSVLRRVILPGTFEYTRNYLIDQEFDLSAFEEQRKPG